MTEAEKNRLLVTWLIANAKTRLFLSERRKQATDSPPMSDVSFLPLAAKGHKQTKTATILSQDYNFAIHFTYYDDKTHCLLQAKGYAAVAAMKNKAVQLCFAAEETFVLHFDGSGCAEINLPKDNKNGQEWHVMSANLTIL